MTSHEVLAAGVALALVLSIINFLALYGGKR